MFRKPALAVLALTTAALAGDFPYYYDLEPPAAERYGGSEIISGGGWLPLPAREYPGTVRVFSGETLRARGYLYLGNALAEEAGIYVEYVPGRYGPLFAPRFRGASAREVLVLIDGVPANDLAGGWADLKLVPVEAVDRVEVFPGPASHRWGDRAVAGCVNVVTMKGPREAARALVSASDGAYDAERYRFNFGMTTHGVDLFMSGNRKISREPNTIRRADHAYSRNSSANIDGRAAYRWGDTGEVDLVAAHFTAYESLLEPDTWEFINTPPGLQKDWQDRIRLYGRRRMGAGEGRAEVYYAATRTWYNGGGAGPPLPGQTHAREEAGRLSYTIPHLDGSALTFDAGGGYRENPDAGEATPLVAAGVLEEMRIPKRPVYMAVGASYDALTRPAVGALSPRLAVAAFPRPWFKAYGSFSGGVRLPSAGELGRTDKVTRERGYEAGARLYGKGFAEAGVAYFYSHGSDVYLDGEDEWVDQLRRRGVDASAEGKLPFRFDWSGSYCYTDARLPDGTEAGFVPRHRAFGKLGCLQRFLKDDLGVRTDALLEYTGARRRAYAPADVPPFTGPNLKIPYRYELPPYWQLGAHFGLIIVSFEGYVNIENINRARDYVIRPGWSMPRRIRTFVGFNWTLYD